jgi:teichuronic acid biosynthesis glycosyltransferase TuaH
VNSVLWPTNVIFVSMEDWDQVWRRNQFVCATLAQRHPTMKILFVGMPVNVSRELRHGRLLLRAATVPAPGVAGVTVTHPVKLLPDSLPGGRAINGWLFRHHVRRVARLMGLGRREGPVLWLNPHGAVHMAGRMGESAVVYDVTDDWSQMSQSVAAAELVRRQDAELCGKADAVIVCSERLAELKRPLNRNVHLILNGVDAGHYAGVLDGGAATPAAAAGWRRPVLGYTGTVHPDRVDVELVRTVAERWAGSVVLVGPDLLRGEDRERLDLPNVHRVGPVAYADVPGVMAAFDVCVVPHRMTAFTESLNPIKLWEYLAAGKPIVSTDVAGFRDFPELVRLARTADEFVAAAHAAVAEAGTAEGAKLAEGRRAVAAENSWERRVDEVERVIEKC